MAMIRSPLITMATQSFVCPPRPWRRNDWVATHDHGDPKIGSPLITMDRTVTPGYTIDHGNPKGTGVTDVDVPGDNHGLNIYFRTADSGAVRFTDR